MNAIPVHPIRRLFPRQKEILIGISEGKGRGEIAGELGISPKTVEGHCLKLGKLFGSTHPAILTRAALKLGFTSLCFLMLCLPVKAASVILGWCPSADTNVISYAVEWNTFTGGCTTNFGVFTNCGVITTNHVTCGPWTNKVSVGNVTGTTISNLLFATTYGFTVTASNGMTNESQPSFTVIVKTPPPQPPAPTGLHVVP